MACHPSGIVVDVVGIEEPSHGRSCENHQVCGSVIVPDAVVRFRTIQLERKENPDGDTESQALAVCHVTGGVDCCRVGFLRRHLLKHEAEYDGRIAQVTDVFSATSESPSDRHKYHRNRGCCRAVLIEAEYRQPVTPPTKRQKVTNNKEV